MGCRACPLNKMEGGDMAPMGSDCPLIYILGEAPGADEADEQKHFVGEPGQLLRAYLPRKLKDQIRYNTVVRSPTEYHAPPDKTAIECCRPSVRQDIERTKPKAIFGLGEVPLAWVSGFSGVSLWRGRRMPVKVGTHTCWFYSLQDPSVLLERRRNGAASEEERMFVFDIKRALAEVESLPPAVVHTVADVRRNVEIITAGGTKGLAAVKEALNWASTQEVIGVDYETNGIRPYVTDSKILSAAVANGERAVAFSFDHPESFWSASDRVAVEELWVRFLRDAACIKAVHNLAFELEWTGVKFGR
jgi:uracil-DNA glycosylase family 4